MPYATAEAEKTVTIEKMEEVPWWEGVIEWWNNLPWWKKALIVASGGVAVGTSISVIIRRKM